MVIRGHAGRLRVAAPDVDDAGAEVDRVGLAGQQRKQRDRLPPDGLRDPERPIAELLGPPCVGDRIRCCEGVEMSPDARADRGRAASSTDPSHRPRTGSGGRARSRGAARCRAGRVVAGARTASHPRSARSSAGHRCRAGALRRSSTPRRSDPRPGMTAFRVGPPSSSSERIPRSARRSSTQRGSGRSSGAAQQIGPGRHIGQRIPRADHEDARLVAGEPARIGRHRLHAGDQDPGRIRRQPSAARRAARSSPTRSQTPVARSVPTPLPTASNAAR